MSDNSQIQGRAGRGPDSALTTWLAGLPWWGLILALCGLVGGYFILTSPNYRTAFDLFVFGRPETSVAIEGLLLTIEISLASYFIAIVIGLITGLARVSQNPVFYTLSTLYVEIGRGTPFVVLILYTAYVITPVFVNLIAGLGAQLNLASLAAFTIRDVSPTLRAIIALSIGYGAYESEVFRGGIQSIERGQMEAARSLGMTYFQAMRYVILPQAFRRVLPPLGNDFIACLKDSSLATVIAVPEITQLSRIERSRTFRVFEVFNTLAYMYLVMTISLSLLVRALERRLSTND